MDEEILCHGDGHGIMDGCMVKQWRKKGEGRWVGQGFTAIQGGSRALYFDVPSVEIGCIGVSLCGWLNHWNSEPALLSIAMWKVYKSNWEHNYETWSNISIMNASQYWSVSAYRTVVYHWTTASRLFTEQSPAGRHTIRYVQLMTSQRESSLLFLKAHL